MTEAEWGLFIAGVFIGLAFCGSFVLGAMWMFKTVTKLQACGFRILTWRDMKFQKEPIPFQPSLGDDK